MLPHDLDLFGHVNNGRYLTIMDVARLDLLVRSGLWSRIRARGWYPVVAGQTITYRRSLTLGQRFVVESRVLGTYDRWSYVEQTFL
ncbi:acyl-CoA thioesterase, partial [Clavibacter michiganensis]|uniref:acyl-CoA thioesterase n=1 Tax=Clavibacter michiganensis TaxID=28447 RepID=UPI00292D2AB5